MERKWCMNTEAYTHTHIVIGTHTLFVGEIISKTHSSALIFMSNMDLKAQLPHKWKKWNKMNLINHYKSVCWYFPCNTKEKIKGTKKSYNRSKKKIVSTKTLSSTTFLQHRWSYSWALNQYIRMISEGSRDTEDWSNDAENSAFHDKNKLHFKIY